MLATMLPHMWYITCRGLISAECVQLTTFPSINMTIECASGKALTAPEPPSISTQPLLTDDEADAKYRCALRCCARKGDRVQKVRQESRQFKLLYSAFLSDLFNASLHAQVPATRTNAAYRLGASPRCELNWCSLGGSNALKLCWQSAATRTFVAGPSTHKPRSHRRRRQVSISLW